MRRLVAVVLLAGCSDGSSSPKPDARVPDAPLLDGAFADVQLDAADAAADDAAIDSAFDAAIDAAPFTGRILLVGSGGASLFTAVSGPGGAWSSSSIAEASTHAPAVALARIDDGLVVYRATTGDLRAAAYTATGFGAPAGIGPSITTRERPAVVALAGGAYGVAFHGADYKHYYAQYAGAWNPTAEPIGGASTQSFGPTPPALTADGPTPVTAFIGGDQHLYDQERAAGSWQAPHDHAQAGLALVPAAVVHPSTGPERLAVFLVGGQLRFTTRTDGTWSSPLDVADALTNDPPVLAALPSGDVELAFRGQDMRPYAARFSNGTWSAVTLVANTTIPATPALAPGIGGYDAELVFIENGTAKHTRLTNTTWSSPLPVGGTGLLHLALASTK